MCEEAQLTINLNILDAQAKSCNNPKNNANRLPLMSRWILRNKGSTHVISRNVMVCQNTAKKLTPSKRIQSSFVLTA